MCRLYLNLNTSENEFSFLFSNVWCCTISSVVSFDQNIKDNCNDRFLNGYTFLFQLTYHLVNVLVKQLQQKCVTIRKHFLDLLQTWSIAFGPFEEALSQPIYAIFFVGCFCYFVHFFELSQKNQNGILNIEKYSRNFAICENLTFQFFGDKH